MQSMEEELNRLFRYPIIFLNDKDWCNEFKDELNLVVSGQARFETITILADLGGVIQTSLIRKGGYSMLGGTAIIICADFIRVSVQPSPSALESQLIPFSANFTTTQPCSHTDISGA